MRVRIKNYPIFKNLERCIGEVLHNGMNIHTVRMEDGFVIYPYAHTHPHSPQCELVFDTPSIVENYSIC